MRWRTHARWEVRRRAVVGGRALDAEGRPLADASSLKLCRVADDAAPAAAPKRKGKSAKPAPDVQAAPVRCYPAHLKRDGSFFFLDVPSGRYVLRQIDAAGAVVKTQDVVLAPFDLQAALPIVGVEFEVVTRAVRN